MARDRVIVGMSGGVDSAVAAALLVEQGYDVIGVTMRLWTEARPAALRGKQQCCSVEDIDDARRVAGQLGIRHYVMNFEREFRELVVNQFVGEYSQGRTPNPCVRCNEHIKYRALLDRLPALEARWVATGHYARVVHDPTGHHRLFRSTDATKDQSYVLYMLGQSQLSQLLLPLGELSKSQVRERASELGLEVAEKPESMEICFVPDDDYRGFVSARVPPVQGEFRNSEGRVLGTHPGISGFTVGQRKGLGIAAGEPLYVTAIDAGTNVVTLGGFDDLFAASTEITDVSWIAGEPPAPGRALSAQPRYRAAPVAATVHTTEDGRTAVQFGEPQKALAPGQSMCIYDGEEVIGGGTISRSRGNTSATSAESAASA